MKKKILSIFLIIFFLYGCGYTPMFSSNTQTQINIEIIDITGDDELNSFIIKKIERLNNNSSNEKFSIQAETNYSKETLTKDKTGNTTQYKLNASVTFLIKNEKSDIVINFKENSSMQNFSDEFEQSNYEKSVKDQISGIFVNRLIISLSRIE